MLRDLIEQAVREHVKPGTGVLLSGGIDSSTVAYFAPTLPAFTGYYKGERYDERRWAKLLTAGRQWHQIEITPQDFIDHFDEMVNVIGPPTEGPGTFGQYMVSRYVAQHVSTVLSGEGGDELFGGYARLHLVAGIPPPDGYEDYVLPDGYPATLAEALDFEWKVNLPALLAVDEKVTQAHGLTAIAPLTDPRVVKHVLAQPDRERVGKVMLKEAMAGALPDEILNRKDKRGFPVPFVEWAQGPLRDFIGDRIGYVPDADKPWARDYWLDLCEASRVLA